MLYQVVINITSANYFTYKKLHKDIKDGQNAVMRYENYKDLKSDISDYLEQLSKSLKISNNNWKDIIIDLSNCILNSIQLLEKELSFIVILSPTEDTQIRISVEKVSTTNYGHGVLEISEPLDAIITSYNQLEDFLLGSEDPSDSGNYIYRVGNNE